MPFSRCFTVPRRRDDVGCSGLLGGVKNMVRLVDNARATPERKEQEPSLAVGYPRATLERLNDPFGWCRAAVRHCESASLRKAEGEAIECLFLRKKLLMPTLELDGELRTSDVKTEQVFRRRRYSLQLE